jgi:hypothetical protein
MFYITRRVRFTFIGCSQPTLQCKPIENSEYYLEKNVYESNGEVRSREIFPVRLPTSKTSRIALCESHTESRDYVNWDVMSKEEVKSSTRFCASYTDDGISILLNDITILAIGNNPDILVKSETVKDLHAEHKILSGESVIVDDTLRDKRVRFFLNRR